MFYPIEDEAELARLRLLMSPFMVNIQKCFSTSESDQEQQELILIDVINSISPVIDPELLNGLNQISQREFSVSTGTIILFHRECVGCLGPILFLPYMLPSRNIICHFNGVSYHCYTDNTPVLQAR